jgi:hypothetical protein
MRGDTEIALASEDSPIRAAWLNSLDSIAHRAAMPAKRAGIFTSVSPIGGTIQASVDRFFFNDRPGPL